MESWVQLLSSGSATTVMAVVLVVGTMAIMRGNLVPGRYYEEVKQDRDTIRTELNQRNGTTSELTKAFQDQAKKTDDLNEAVSLLVSEIRKGRVSS